MRLEAWADRRWPPHPSRRARARPVWPGLRIVRALRMRAERLQRRIYIRVHPTKVLPIGIFSLHDCVESESPRAEGWALREKELRIALVCFGGVSLAVYMHGISKEILKLVRASSALHAIADRSRRARAAFFDGADRSDPEYDTEDVY